VKILVTGRTGQVTTSLAERAANLRDVELVTVARPGFDLMDRASVINKVIAEKPDVVISAAAYTAVDRAEDEPDIAYAVNVTGAGYVAEAAERIGAGIIHLSTDYVFAGTELRAYDEQSRPAPMSIYGLTKLEGERAVARINPMHAVVRTSWVYSPFSSNFLRTMLKLATQQNTIRVVADQWGNPTSALDLADGLLAVARGLREGRYGTYHLTGSGETNWSGFARHLLRSSRALGGPYANITDITTSEYPTKANRPGNSRLCCDKVEGVFGVRLPDWRSSTDRIVARLVKDTVRG
jgi:dTDP-4-dehydrorhamnose reductase